MASCPYLQLARVNDVDYGLVLSFADYLTSSHPDYWMRRANCKLRPEMKRRIENAHQTEMERQRSVKSG